MRGLAEVTVARETILSCRNVHSGLMASHTAPNRRAVSSLRVMLLFCKRLLCTLSLRIIFWFSLDFFWPNQRGVLDFFQGFLQAWGKFLVCRSRWCWWSGNRFFWRTFTCLNVHVVEFVSLFLILVKIAYSSSTGNRQVPHPCRATN